MPEITYAPAVIDAMMQVVADAIDAAATPGHLRIYDDSETPVLLADIELSDPCGSVSGGELLLTCPLEDEALAASGSAAGGVIVDGDGALVAALTVGLATSTAAVRLNQVALYQGGILRITAAALGLG